MIELQHTKLQNGGLVFSLLRLYDNSMFLTGSLLLGDARL